MTNSHYNPQTWVEMEAAKVLPSTVGVTFTASANTTTTNDVLIADDLFVRFLELILNGHQMNDTISMSFIDKDNVLGFGANFVVATPVSNYNIAADQQKQGGYEAIVPKKIPGGIYARFAYTSAALIGTTRVEVNIIGLKALF